VERRDLEKVERCRRLQGGTLKERRRGKGVYLKERLKVVVEVW